MSDRHTAGPWTYREIDPEDKSWGACEILSGDNFVSTHVCSVENAAFIVRACNAHADLVRALKGLLDCAGEELSNASDEMLLDGVGNGPDDLTKEQAQAFLNARAALAKAGEQQ